MPPPGVCLNIMRDRQRQEGHGSLNNPEKFCGQDFEQLRTYCLIKRVRFVDETFPPSRDSIGFGLLQPDEMARVVWKRPRNLHSDPQLYVNDVSRFDLCQGQVGNCWFLASLGALTFQQHIRKQVLPCDQGFQKDYAGIFHFRFWRFGKWVDVVIDDKLPTLDDNLIFVRPKTQNEFWPALLEKAYAKVCGSYADMSSGSVSEALMDFTGGVHVRFNLKEAQPDLWETIERAAKVNSLMGCGTPPVKTSGKNNVLPSGLVEGHAYTVTGVAEVLSNGVPEKLLRLWNPWGREEWIGDWSDESPKWQTVGAKEKKELLHNSDDGEFWMSIEDFKRHFTEVDICNLSPEFLDSGNKCVWDSSVHEGRWVQGATAGGCLNYSDTFWMNPQYRVTLTDILAQENGHTSGSCNILVSLMQKPQERFRHLSPNASIGYVIFQVPPSYKEQRGKFPAAFFNSQSPIAKTKAFINSREVTECFQLKPGDYLIVPSTYKPDETANFILSIFSKTKNYTKDSSTNVLESNIPNLEMPKDPLPQQPIYNYEDNPHKKVFLQYSDQYEEVDAEHLQALLNENILKGKTFQSGGFSLDACKSIIAIMDLSTTGKLNAVEFVRLWKKVLAYQEMFYQKDVSHTGHLSLPELQNAIESIGIKVNDELLNLMALRYGDSSGRLTLESYMCLMLRLECMAKIFQNLSDGKGMYLRPSEWLFLTMYS
ncbi:calpain-9-like isoform X1 [Lepisosteus oculatus]|uniref:calpain-9-like isoform X1 n=1 Tax=Lepisosteus oculatus TaxID=7918 RepID=UPI0035F502C2